MNEGGEKGRVKMGEKIDVSEEPEENNGWRRGEKEGSGDWN